MIHKVIFCGLPFKLNDETNELWGFWDFLLPILLYAENGGGWLFMVYEGSYIKALIKWLKD